MSSQWAKARAMAAWVAGSASSKLSSVASENTTPKPKVSSGRLRSRTTTSWAGSAFFIKIAKYRPAGPPPIETIFTLSIVPDRPHRPAVRILHVSWAAPSDATGGSPGENMMKTTSYIGIVVAAGAVALGVLGAPGDGITADATKPTYQNYRPQATRPQPSGPSDNDHHANYHADYTATQDGRPAPPKNVDAQADPRDGARKFQDGDRAIRSPYGWRR